MASPNARRLRKNQTDAEQRLWSLLRRKQIGQHRFRRQVPLGPYIADFVCLDARLIIEVDGGQHAERTDEDSQRTAWLKSQNFRVLRFWNNDVFENMEGVLAIISSVLEEPPPQPSPARGEGGLAQRDPAP
ncbi:MAG: hypothetical protein K0Q70_684 [Rhodospirillales bacterium]|nr:hypothetical protein [Rhodospirillales bacterium]